MKERKKEREITQHTCFQNLIEKNSHQTPTCTPQSIFLHTYYTLYNNSHPQQNHQTIHHSTLICFQTKPQFYFAFSSSSHSLLLIKHQWRRLQHIQRCHHHRHNHRHYPKTPHPPTSPLRHRCLSVCRSSCNRQIARANTVPTSSSGGSGRWSGHSPSSCRHARCPR